MILRGSTDTRTAAIQNISPYPNNIHTASQSLDQQTPTVRRLQLSLHPKEHVGTKLHFGGIAFEDDPSAQVCLPARVQDRGGIERSPRFQLSVFELLDELLGEAILESVLPDEYGAKAAQVVAFLFTSAFLASVLQRLIIAFILLSTNSSKLRLKIGSLRSKTSTNIY